MNEAWDRAQRILCVRLDNMGDVLMSTPAMHALKHSRPGRRLTLLASGSGAEAARFLPDVDDIIRYDAPWMKFPTGSGHGTDLAMCRRLAREAFDAAVIFTVYSQSPLPAALLCHLAGIPLRLAHCRENPYALLSDWVPESEPGPLIRHETQRQLDLVAKVGAQTADARLRFRVPEQARSAMKSLAPPVGGRTVVLHPGSTAASRRYPAERFGEVAAELAARHGCQVLITGGRDEMELAASICAQAAGRGRVRSLAGLLRLEELAALIERSDLLVSNNSGPVHIAAAVGTPVVDLYALTNPQHTPWMVPHRVLFHDVPCKYCYKSTCPQGHNDCLRRVAPADVVKAACELLEEGATSAPFAAPSFPISIPA